MKKVLTISLIVSLLVVSSIGFALADNEHKNPRCKGDFNGDGRVNSGDIYKFVQFWDEHNHKDFWYADMTRDGFVDMRDREEFRQAVMQNRTIDCRPGK